MNTSSKVPDSERVEMINKWAQKLVNSGHKQKEVRSIILSGLKGYISKVKKCEKNGTPLHRCAKTSFGARRLAKLTGKSNWFRKKKKEDDLGNKNNIWGDLLEKDHHQSQHDKDYQLHGEGGGKSSAERGDQDDFSNFCRAVQKRITGSKDERDCQEARTTAWVPSEGC